MRFMDRLNISVRRGALKTVTGGIRIPKDVDMRVLFPNCRSCSYRTVKRSMQRAGFTYCYQRDAWIFTQLARQRAAARWAGGALLHNPLADALAAEHMSAGQLPHVLPRAEVFTADDARPVVTLDRGPVHLYRRDTIKLGHVDGVSRLRPIIVK